MGIEWENAIAESKLVTGGDQRPTAIRGKTLLQRLMLHEFPLVINALRQSKVKHSFDCPVIRSLKIVVINALRQSKVKHNLRFNFK